MDRINQYSEKIYLVGFENQDILTFNQGVTGSNPVGLTTFKVRTILQRKIVILFYFNDAAIRYNQLF